MATFRKPGFGMILQQGQLQISQKQKFNLHRPTVNRKAAELFWVQTDPLLSQYCDQQERVIRACLTTRAYCGISKQAVQATKTIKFNSPGAPALFRRDEPPGNLRMPKDRPFQLFELALLSRQGLIYNGCREEGLKGPDMDNRVKIRRSQGAQWGFRFLPSLLVLSIRCFLGGALASEEPLGDGEGPVARQEEPKSSLSPAPQARPATYAHIHLTGLLTETPTLDTLGLNGEEITSL